jgi:hypothetical protein
MSHGSGPEQDQVQEELRFEQESENEALIYYKGPQVRTLDELYKAMDVDLDVWEAYQVIPKTYQAQAKREIKKLEMVNGVANGTIDTGGMIVTTLFGWEVRMARREPHPIRPLIFPVVSAQRFEIPERPTRGGLRTALIGSDAQIGFEKSLQDGKLTPFHDRRALDLFLQVATEEQPDEIHLPGDWFDLPESSTHFTRSPEMQMTTQPAIYEGHLWLAWLRSACPTSEIYFYEGNHELRIPDSIAQYLPWAYDLRRADAPYDFPVLSVPHLLGLERLGIRWLGGYPDNVHWFNEHMFVEHGNTTKLKADRPFVILRGHDHRVGLQAKTHWGREGPFYAMEIGLGCLSSTRAPGRQSRENWQQSFALVSYEPDDELLGYNPAIILDGRMIWNGRIYEGRDRTGAIRRAYPDLRW